MKQVVEQYAVQVAVPGIPMILSYALPREHQMVAIGQEVVVDVGRRKTTGWVIGKESAQNAIDKLSTNLNKRASRQLSLFAETAVNVKKLKPIISASPGFLSDQLPLFEWMSNYYGATISEIIENAVPKKSSSKPISYIKYNPDLLMEIKADKDYMEKFAKRSPSQAKVLDLLSQIADSQDKSELIPVSELKQLGGSIYPAIKAMEKKNLFEIVKSHPELRYDKVSSESKLYSNFEPQLLTKAQQQALEEINKGIHNNSYSPYLLFGVTGSGKTEVYLRAIQEALRVGGSALLIVPEIALTPQLLDIFQSRLKEPIAVLHSQVGSSARWDAWDRLLKGELRVAIGARSAVFAPLKDIRLIIVDEEHDGSYKQSDGLRYHGRDVAVMRAKLTGCVVVLGSATPSFESILNVKRSRYKLLEMPERVTTRPVPALEIIDLNKIKRKEMPSENISPMLHSAIEETLNQKGQVIILYNRRGFSSFLQCNTCAEVVRCPNCSVTFTYHKGRHKLLCHYCNLTITPPELCQFCRNKRTSRVEEAANEKPVGVLEHRGGGTEKVVDELITLFPDATVSRMDRDTVGRKGSYRSILGDVRSGRTDILVGTQMIAKGHDLPGVTLVGIIDADVGLHLPDFRSSEKIYQLITQAAGRAGRGEVAGRVLVQTREPMHPTILATATNRFFAFARFELDNRKSFRFPPWGRLLRLIISSTDKKEAMDFSQMVKDTTEGYLKNIPSAQISLIGPTPAPIERLRGRFRYQLIIKSTSSKPLSYLARELNTWKNSQTIRKLAEFRLAIDIDPIDML
jgi:primosomal protein N' (replication factor Y) (superfamily II helicase)